MNYRITSAELKLDKKLNEPGEIEICCERCRQLICFWSILKDAEYGPETLKIVIKNHKCK